MSSIQSRQLEGIFKVSNFVSNYQIDDINGLLSSTSCSMNAETMKKMKLCRLQEELQSLSIFAGYLMEKQFNVHLNWTSLSPSIVFLQKENHQPHIHADNETLDGKPKLNYENFDVSGVMYLSSTFGGGEIEFVHQNITIKPEYGDLIFFPGDARYAHFVHQVESGLRVSSPMWFSIVS